MGIYRLEVLKANRTAWLGEINVSAPLSRWLITALSIALGAAIVTFLVIGECTRQESVTGRLVPTSGLLNVTASSPSTVTSMFVHDGQSVHRGDALLEISSSQDSATLGDTRVLVIHHLSEQKARLQNDLATQQEITQQQASSLRKKLNLLNEQITQISAQLGIQKQQVTSAQTLLDRIRPLSLKNYVSAVQIQQQESALLDVQSQYKTLLRQQLELRQQANTTEQQLSQSPFDATTQRNETERKIADIDQSIAQNELERATLLRAPSDGLISSLLLKAGQTVSTG